MNFPTFQLSNDFGALHIAEYGGQLLSWKDANGCERLYSPESLSIKPGRALRGGVPICFPQFSGRGLLPKHGLVRTRPWRLIAQTDTALMLTISDTESTRSLWPHGFSLLQTLILDDNGLSVTLDFHNRSDAPLVFTAALHTYLRVPDGTACSLQGLHGRDYEDAADDGRFKTQHGDLTVAGEVDRVFADAPKRLHLDYGNGERLSIAQGGFNDTVVWCPGPEIAAGLDDMPREDWQRMLCVEAAAAAAPVTVLADGHWQGWQRLTPMP
jgi:glucose-6-phosphate 1-epimerase